MTSTPQDGFQFPPRAQACGRAEPDSTAETCVESAGSSCQLPRVSHCISFRYSRGLVTTFIISIVCKFAQAGHCKNKITKGSIRAELVDKYTRFNLGEFKEQQSYC